MTELFAKLAFLRHELVIARAAFETSYQHAHLEPTRSLADELQREPLKKLLTVQNQIDELVSIVTSLKQSA